MPNLNLSALPLSPPQKVRLQVKGFKGNPDDEEFQVILHDGLKWLVVKVHDRYRALIKMESVPEVGDIVEIGETIGSHDNLHIVRILSNIGRYYLILADIRIFYFNFIAGVEKACVAASCKKGDDWSLAPSIELLFQDQ